MDEGWEACSVRCRGLLALGQAGFSVRIGPAAARGAHDVRWKRGGGGGPLAFYFLVNARTGADRRCRGWAQSGCAEGGGGTPTGSCVIVLVTGGTARCSRHAPATERSSLRDAAVARRLDGQLDRPLCAAVRSGQDDWTDLFGGTQSGALGWYAVSRWDTGRR